MRIIINSTVLATLLLLASYTWSQGMVWLVESGEKKLYIGGTIHVLASEDYPLPGVFDKAYIAADSLIFEMDLALQNTPEFQQAMMLALFYQDGQLLNTVLDTSTWQLFMQWCKSNNIRHEQFLSMKPGLVSVTISMTELAKLGVKQQGVDAYYYQKAIADKKPYAGLETMQQQLSFLAAMGNKNPNRLLQATLKEVDEIPVLFPKVKKAWRNNNLKDLDALLVDDMRTKQPEIYQDLLISRNQQWLTLLNAELLDEGVEFVLVGAAHLVGDKGLLAYWKNKGYRVTPLH